MRMAYNRLHLSSSCAQIGLVSQTVSLTQGQ